MRKTLREIYGWLYSTLVGLLLCSCGQQLANPFVGDFNVDVDTEDARDGELEVTISKSAEGENDPVSTNPNGEVYLTVKNASANLELRVSKELADALYISSANVVPSSSLWTLESHKDADTNETAISNQLIDSGYETLGIVSKETSENCVTIVPPQEEGDSYRWHYDVDGVWRGSFRVQEDLFWGVGNFYFVDTKNNKKKKRMHVHYSSPKIKVQSCIAGLGSGKKCTWNENFVPELTSCDQVVKLRIVRISKIFSLCEPHLDQGAENPDLLFCENMSNWKEFVGTRSKGNNWYYLNIDVPAKAILSAKTETLEYHYSDRKTGSKGNLKIDIRINEGLSCTEEEL